MSSADSLEIFTRALAHDLKEPMRTIKSFLSIINAHEPMSEKGQGYFNYIQNAADRMAALIDAVYFYTRLDGSPQEIAKESCDVATVLEDAKADISALIRERNAAHFQRRAARRHRQSQAIGAGAAEPSVQCHPALPDRSGHSYRCGGRT